MTTKRGAWASPRTRGDADAIDQVLRARSSSSGPSSSSSAVPKAACLARAACSLQPHPTRLPLPSLVLRDPVRPLPTLPDARPSLPPRCGPHAGPAPGQLERHQRDGRQPVVVRPELVVVRTPLAEAAPAVQRPARRRRLLAPAPRPGRPVSPGRPVAASHGARLTLLLATRPRPALPALPSPPGPTRSRTSGQSCTSKPTRPRRPATLPCLRARRSSPGRPTTARRQRRCLPTAARSSRSQRSPTRRAGPPRPARSSTARTSFRARATRAQRRAGTARCARPSTSTTRPSGCVCRLLCCVPRCVAVCGCWRTRVLLRSPLPTLR